MLFSLIVTTVDRQAELQRLFNSIAAQVLPSEVEIEIILVNQGLASLPPLPLGIGSAELRTEGQVSLSKARNAGLKLISGDIVGFPDDDCWYEKDVIEKVARYFSENADVGCICTNIFDPERSKSYGHRPVGVTLQVNFRNVTQLPSSVGMFIRRVALEKAGNYFDESLGVGTSVGSGEEMELVARMLEADIRVEYLGEIQVYHPVLNETTAASPQKSFKYGIGFGYINGILLKAGHWGALLNFMNIVLRSIAGCFVNCMHPVGRRAYWNRLCGILQGVVQGIVG